MNTTVARPSRSRIRQIVHDLARGWRLLWHPDATLAPIAVGLADINADLARLADAMNARAAVLTARVEALHTARCATLRAVRP
jgi:hypothetical protein